MSDIAGHPAVAPQSDAAEVSSTTRGVARLASIDQVRGLVIALMVLDHVRDFFTSPAVSPTDLDETTVGLFLTRWITHYCAPTFVFLAGTSASLSGRRKSRSELGAFLVKRGVWIAALEFTVVRFAWSFDLDYGTGLFLLVMWAIGASMVVLAALVRLPVGVVGAFGVFVMAAHNLLDGLPSAPLGLPAPVWSVLHVPGRVPFGFVGYPLIPWIGVMAAGYAFGSVYAWPAAKRRRLLVQAGLGMTAAFVVLRASGGYGDPSPWSTQPTPAFTALSFLNVTKYPPSLDYLLMTLGPMLVLLAAFERWPKLESRVLVTFGRVPLFAYVVHLMIAHLAAVLTAVAVGFDASLLLVFPFFYPPEWGFPLPVVYLAWVGVLALLYLVSRWFAGVKTGRRDWWLQYL